MTPTPSARPQLTSAAPRAYRQLAFMVMAAFATFGCAEKGPSLDQLLSRANDAYSADKYHEAEKAYREVLRRAPENPVALRALGRSLGLIPHCLPLRRTGSAMSFPSWSVRFQPWNSSGVPC